MLQVCRWQDQNRPLAHSAPATASQLLRLYTTPRLQKAQTERRRGDKRMRELFAMVTVYEEDENGKIALHEQIRLTPEVYHHITEDGLKYDSHWFHLKVTTYEGMVTDNERNN